MNVRDHNQRADDNDWHTRKGSLIAVIAAILIHAGAFVWYASSVNSTVQLHTSDIATLKGWKDKQDDDKAKIESHLAVIDQKLTDQSEKMTDQSKILQRIDDRMQTQAQLPPRK